MTRGLSAITFALCVAGCGGGPGAERWLSATRENVSVEGAPYHVAWLRAGPREIDFRSHRDQPIYLNPDMALEQRRNVEAAMVVARRECGVQKVEADGIVRADLQFSGRIRCG